MVDAFDMEIVRLENELRAYKSADAKSATMLQTQIYTQQISFDLELVSVQGVTMVRSDKAAIIEFESGDNNPLVSVNYEISGLDNRTIRDIPYYDTQTDRIGRMVFIYSNNQSDLSTLQGGGSVNLNYTMKITSTAEMSISVSYQDLWVN